MTDPHTSLIPLSVSRSGPQPIGHPVAAYILFLVFPSLPSSYLSFNNMF